MKAKYLGELEFFLNLEQVLNRFMEKIKQLKSRD